MLQSEVDKKLAEMIFGTKNKNEYDLIYTKGEFYPPRPIDTLDAIRHVDADLLCPFCASENIFELPIRQINLGLGQTKLVANQSYCWSCRTYFDPSFSWWWIPDYDTGVHTIMCHEGFNWTIWVPVQGVGPMHRRDVDAQQLLYEYYYGLQD